MSKEGKISGKKKKESDMEILQTAITNVSLEEEEREEDLEDAVFKIFSSDYQYHPLLGIIFSYLRTHFIINTICLVSSHFKNIVSEISILSELTVRGEGFSERSDPTSKRLFRRFFNQIIEKRFRTKTLSISDSIFMSYFLETLGKEGKIHEEVSRGKKNKKKKTSKSSKTSLVYFSLIKPSMRTISNLTAFERLFSQVQKLELLGSQLSKQKASFGFRDIITFLNSIPHLQHFIIHHFRLRFIRGVEDIETGFETLEEHKSLRILQLRCHESYFDNQSSSQMMKRNEQMAVEFMEKCPNLYIFELPYLEPHHSSQSVFFDELMSSQGVQRMRDIPPPVDSSPLKAYLRKRFLDHVDSQNGSFTSEFQDKLSEEKILHKDYFSLFYDPLFYVYQGRSGKYYSQTNRENFFLIQGVPFRFKVRCSSSSIYLVVHSPFVQYFATTKVSQEKFLSRRDPLQLQRMLRVYENRRFGGGISVQHFLCNHPGLSNLKNCELNSRSFNFVDHFGRKSIPVNLTIENFFTTKEYKYLKSEDSIREAEYEKHKQDVKAKEEKILEVCLKQQGLHKAVDSVEFIMDIDEYSKKMGSCTHCFSLFGDDHDLLDFQFQLKRLGNPKRRDRGVYLKVLFPTGELYLPFCYRITITILEFEDEEFVPQEFQREYVFTSFLKYRSSGNFGFDYMILPKEQQQQEEEEEYFYVDDFSPVMEQRVKVDIRMEFLDYTMSPSEYIDNHRRFYESIVGEDKLPIEETKKLVLFVPQYGVSWQTGIHQVFSHQSSGKVEEKHIQNIDPRIRKFRLCGIDFTVEFQNGTFLEHQLSRIWFNLGILSNRKKTDQSGGSKLIFEGCFTVKVLKEGEEGEEEEEEEEENMVIKEVKQEMYHGTETCISVCEGERKRKMWSFLVTLKLENVTWLKE